jgi:hypothetical protein
MSTAKILYGAQAALTLTLASLASDANLLAGRASAAVDNTSDRYDDVEVAGVLRTGTSPTANKTIEVWAYAAYDDSPLYVDGITGSDAAKTMTSANVKNAALRLLWSCAVDATSDRYYYMPPTSLADRFGFVPKRWGVFVVHDTVAALNASGHQIKYRGLNYESI